MFDSRARQCFISRFVFVMSDQPCLVSANSNLICLLADTEHRCKARGTLCWSVCYIKRTWCFFAFAAPVADHAIRVCLCVVLCRCAVAALREVLIRNCTSCRSPQSDEEVITAQQDAKWAPMPDVYGTHAVAPRSPRLTIALTPS